MSLFIDNTTNFLAVETDISSIVRCDRGLAEVIVPGDDKIVQLTYDQNSLGAGERRIAELVSNRPKIVISAVDPSLTFSDGTQITAEAGTTFVDDDGVIRVVYDASQARGQHYFVVDVDGNRISFPNPVLLFHELSHAFHIAIGDMSPDKAEAEFQAITDENALRSQLDLTLRDPNNDFGGIGFIGGEQVPPCSQLVSTGSSGTADTTKVCAWVPRWVRRMARRTGTAVVPQRVR